jgi:hypothetical protein
MRMCKNEEESDEMYDMRLKYYRASSWDVQHGASNTKKKIEISVVLSNT